MQPNLAVNYLAVIVGAVAAFVIGFIWYTPLFGKQWARLTGVTQMQPPPAMFVIPIAAALVNSWVLAVFSLNLGGKTIADGIMLGVLVWLGFFATSLTADAVFGKRPWALYAINAGHALVVQVVVAAIVTAWR